MTLTNHWLTHSANKPGNDQQLANKSPTVKHGGANIRLWGGFQWYELIRIQERMNKTQTQRGQEFQQFT